MKHKKWKKSEVIVAILLDLVGIVAIVALSGILLEYVGGNTSYKDLEKYVILPDEQEELPVAEEERATNNGQIGQNEGADDADGGETTAGVVYYGQCPQVDFASLRVLNSDVVGWIYGPGTRINYPVVQGTDNSFYLTHMFDGKENKCGSIFMDSLNNMDFSNTNSVLHGHHMKNGSMFASLTEYESQAYYDSHPVLWLATPEKSYQVEIFTGFVTDVDSEVWQIEFATKEEYKNWLGQMKERGMFECDVIPGIEDQILTLATCSYKYEDARFVVMGIMREVSAE